MRKPCSHWLTHKLQLHFFIICQYLGTVSIYTLAPLFMPFFPSSLDSSHLGMFLFCHKSKLISALRSLHWLFPLPGIFFSLIFSHCSVPPIIYTEFHLISVTVVNSFSVPTSHYCMTVVVCPFIPLPAPVISKQWSGSLFHLSKLLKSSSKI